MHKNKFYLVNTKQPQFFIALKLLGVKEESLIGWDFIDPLTDPKVFVYLTYDENNQLEMAVNSHGGTYKNSQYMGEFNATKELRKLKLDKLKLL